MVGVMIGPIIAGNMAAYVGWQWFFWLCTICQAINVISTIFLFPETYRQDNIGASQVTGSDGVMQAHDMEAHIDTKPKGPDGVMLSPKVDEKRDAQIEDQSGRENAWDEHLGRGRPSRAQFRIFQVVNPRAKETFLYHLTTPIRIVFLPIILWASLCMCFASIALFIVNVTQAQALSVAPYNFSPANVGFANFAMAVGGVAGLFISGPFSDWVAMRSTRRNGGIREAEMRLPAVIPFIAAAALAMIVNGPLVVDFERWLTMSFSDVWSGFSNGMAMGTDNNSWFRGYWLSCCWFANSRDHCKFWVPEVRFHADEVTVCY
jgi:hypothetical protein